MALNTRYVMIDNYIYLYHIDTFIIIPSFTDSVTDSTSVSFASSTPLARSAPIYSYQNSGPRSLRVQFHLHRDMMKEINYGISNAPLKLNMPDNDDYVDLMTKAVQAAALPKYEDALKMVNPPVVAVRLGSDIFIKGVVVGDVGVTYQLPIIGNGHYADITLAFNINEIDPYDATDVIKVGSYRGLPTSLERFSYNSNLGPYSEHSYFNSITGQWIDTGRPSGGGRSPVAETR